MTLDAAPALDCEPHAGTSAFSVAGLTRNSEPTRPYTAKGARRDATPSGKRKVVLNCNVWREHDNVVQPVALSHARDESLWAYLTDGQLCSQTLVEGMRIRALTGESTTSMAACFYGFALMASGGFGTIEALASTGIYGPAAITSGLDLFGAAGAVTSGHNYGMGAAGLSSADIYGPVALNAFGSARALALPADDRSRAVALPDRADVYAVAASQPASGIIRATGSLPVPVVDYGAALAAQPLAARLIDEAITLTGMTHEQLAPLLGVTRRSLSNWKGGETISGRKEMRLRGLVEALRALATGDADITRARLYDRTPGGLRPYDLLAEGRFDVAVQLATGRPAPAAVRPIDLPAVPPPPAPVLARLSLREDVAIEPHGQVDLRRSRRLKR